MSDQKARAILDTRTPKNVAELRSFLGMLNFCQVLAQLVVTAPPTSSSSQRSTTLALDQGL